MYGCVVSDAADCPAEIPIFQLHTDVPSSVKRILASLKTDKKDYFVHLPYNLVLGYYPSKYIIDFIEGLAEKIPHQAKMVIHFGSAKKGATIDNVVKLCNQLGDVINPRQLLLENMASPNLLGSNLRDLELIYPQVDSKIGFCLDTQHSFSSGMIDWRDIAKIRESLNRLTTITGGIDLIHLNDSKVKFGSGIDRHESLGRGYIWRGQVPILRQVIREAYRRNIPVVPETTPNLSDAQYIGRVIKRYRDKKPSL